MIRINRMTACIKYIKYQNHMNRVFEITIPSRAIFEKSKE